MVYFPEMAVYFRICRSRYSGSSMDGEGARLHGGRWNPPGLAVVYLAESRALAALEILVHASRDALILDWLLLEVEIPDRLVGVMEAKDLPEGWDCQPSSPEARAIGRKWISEAKYPALKVPSAVIPEEYAVLLNPRHGKISQMKISEPRAFPFDRRLLG